MSDRLPRSRPVHDLERIAREALVCGLLLGVGSVLTTRGETGTYRGRPLTDVLIELRERGLNIVFSSAVVSDDLVVSVEHSKEYVRIIAGFRGCQGVAFQEIETGLSPGKSSRGRVSALIKNVVKGAEKSCKLKAPSVEPGRYDLVIHPSNLWLTIHESIGHATELDRALGYEANYAGTSFATYDKLGSLQYGSGVMNVTGDRTVEHGLATIGYDDEGVQTQSWDIVRNGVLVGYLPIGFPDLATSIDAAVALVENGVDALELGLPYSDPVMDGLTIQKATQASLAAGFRVRDVFTAVDLPMVHAEMNPQNVTAARRSSPRASRVERARAFLKRVDPAVSGQGGDLQTFRVCCRIVRGFDLSDDQAVRVLSEWNARCEPPWSEPELRQKVMNARKYGREPLGSLL